MAPPRLPQFWIEQICTLVINAPESRPPTAPAIQKELKKVENAPAWIPSTRAIGRIKAKVIPKMTLQERQRYKFFTWPESMPGSGLPWEASRTVLDLIRYRAERKLAPPLIQEVQWFYRVTLAIPDASIEERMRLTIRLLALGSVSDAGELGRKHSYIEKLLAFQPWRSPQDQEAYADLPLALRTDPGPGVTEDIATRYASSGVREMLGLPAPPDTLHTWHWVPLPPVSSEPPPALVPITITRARPEEPKRVRVAVWNVQNTKKKVLRVKVKKGKVNREGPGGTDPSRPSG